MEDMYPCSQDLFSKNLENMWLLLYHCCYYSTGTLKMTDVHRLESLNLPQTSII